jgi:hypothetical protein
MIVRKEEFLAWKQGPLSFSEYRDKFLQLSRYAPEDVNTDAKRQYHFLRGLVDPLHYQLMNHTISTFQHLIDITIMTQRKRWEIEDRKRKISGPHAGSSSRPHFSSNPPQQFKQNHPQGHQHQHQRQHQQQYQSLFPQQQCWGEGEDATLRSSLRQSRCTNGGKTTGGVHPSSSTLQDEGLRRRRPVPRPHPTWRPTWDSAHCNRPHTEKCVRGPICNGFSIMTVYNPSLWEYSGDSPGA